MKRSLFNLSHYKLATFDMGELIPVGMFEVLPGDTIQQASSALVRVSPLLTPVMHPVVVRIHHWYVPYRILWDNFEKFITGGPDGMDASVFPTRSLTATVGSLIDYMGLPIGASLVSSILPFRAYASIWNENYRDPDLNTAAPLVSTDGNDVTTSIITRNVCWEKDYFTSSRPWTQKGPAVSVPIGTSAVVKTQLGASVTGAQQSLQWTQTDGTAPGTGFSLGIFPTASTSRTTTAATAAGLSLYPNNLIADLSTATASSINDLREAFAIQRYEEARARYGSRYTEYLAYLGVQSPDSRLQRPEYLGGGKQTIQFSEVLQTAPSAAPLPVGNVGELKGHGMGAMRSNRYRRFFSEHGVVLSLMSVIPRTMYMQGHARMWNRRIKEDFWQRELQHIGQQAVLNKEVYGLHSTPDGTFGYQDRYDEYRRQESLVTGEFRTTLNMWHYAREFSSDPALNGTFVSAVPTKRVNAVTSNDVLWVMVNHSIQARRLVARDAGGHIF